VPLEDLSAHFADTGIAVYVKRYDLMNPIWGGNKWFKLIEHVRLAQELHAPQILTFGGAYSNHIAATAALCHQLQIPCVGIIRGDGFDPNNHTLTRAQAAGMQLTFVSRTAYRSKNQPWFLEQLREKFGAFYNVPEGGADALGVLGAMRMVDKSLHKYTHLVVACGTGTTLAGIVAAAASHQTVIGIPVFKEGGFIAQETRNLLTQAGVVPTAKWHLQTAYGMGGYAKIPPEIIDFMARWDHHQLPLDPIYTAKAFRGLTQMVFEGHFEPGSSVVFIHTGGLQGRKDFPVATA
jgi:1-aminocyclopropane-1-carboxylate deaminase